MKITCADSPEWRRLIQQHASESFGLSVSEKQLNQFSRHAEELIRWNKITNLTAITDPAETAVKHFLDSIIPSSCIPLDARILDIGSGGGFPGLPLKVMAPSRRVTMIDAVRKKTSFLSHLIRIFKMEDVEALHIRAEELAENKRYQQAFDIVVCRAFSSAEKFGELALPFLKSDGMMVMLKGRISDDEIAEAESFCRHGFSLKRIDYKLPVTDSCRSLILLVRNKTADFPAGHKGLTGFEAGLADNP